MFVMRLKFLLASSVSFACLLSTASAQTGTWADVQNIRPGSYISIKTEHYNVRCEFHHASDTDLWCKDQFYVRRSIHEIRLERRVASAFVGALGGAGIGAGAGLGLAKGDPEARVYYPLYFGIGAAILGARVMGSMPIIHGKVIYRR